MPTLYQLKPAFQNQLRPLADGLAARKVTPNQLTLTALILSLLGGVGLVVWQSHRWIWSLFCVICPFRMALNALDGMLAREHDLATPLGSILNELGDVIADAALYLPFCFLPQVYSPLVVLAVILSVISEMAGILGAVTIGQRRYDGPAGKSDRALFFSLVALLHVASISLGHWLNAVLVVFLGLLIWTIGNRVYHSLPRAENGLDASPE